MKLWCCTALNEEQDFKLVLAAETKGEAEDKFVKTLEDQGEYLLGKPCAQEIDKIEDGGKAYKVVLVKEGE